MVESLIVTMLAILMIGAVAWPLFRRMRGGPCRCRRLGGAMPQSGILAAAGLSAQALLAVLAAPSSP